MGEAVDNKSVRCSGIEFDAQAFVYQRMPWPRRKHLTVTHDAAERARKALQSEVWADIVHQVVDWMFVGRPVSHHRTAYG